MVNYAQADVGFLDAFSSRRPGKMLGSGITPMTTITFEEWRRRFEKILLARTEAWTALRTYIGFLEQRPSRWLRWMGQENPSRADVRTGALRLIYGHTLPLLQLNEQKRKSNAYTRKALRDSIKQAESVISCLQNTTFNGLPGVFVPGDILAPKIDLFPLLDKYQSMVECATGFLALFDWQCAHKSNVLDQAVSLTIVLERDCKLQERQALALVRLALLAHGYPEDELEDLMDPHKIRAGNFRKRKEASLKRRDSFIRVASSSYLKRHCCESLKAKIASGQISIVEIPTLVRIPRAV